MAKFRAIDPGKKYGRLTIQRRIHNSRCISQIHVVCNCDCGTTNYMVRLRSLELGATQSCGCLRSERSSDLLRKKMRKWGWAA